MARAYRGRPPKRRVTVRKDSINPGSFFGADNYERLRQEVATQGTIDGERLTSEERKEAFKASKSRVDFDKFVSSFFGVEKPKTQTGDGEGTPPPAVPGQNLLPAAPGVSALALKPPTPEPANIPTFWPFPDVNIESIDLTPVENLSSIIPRSSAGIESLLIAEVSSRSLIFPASSIGSPKALTTRPKSPYPHFTDKPSFCK